MLLSYALARTRFLHSFEPEGNGYIYRRRPTSEGFRVSDEERDDLLRAFRRRYFLHQFYFVAGIFVLFGLMFAILLAVPQRISDSVTTAITIVIAGAVFASVFIHQRYLYDIPVKRLAGRAPAVAGQSRKEFRDSYIRRMSWSRFVVSAFILAGLAWLTFPWPASAWWTPFAWLGFFALCFGLMARNMFRKLSLERRDQIGPEF